MKPHKTPILLLICALSFSFPSVAEAGLLFRGGLFRRKHNHSNENALVVQTIDPVSIVTPNLQFSGKQQRNNSRHSPDPSAEQDDDLNDVPYLIQYLGSELYKAVNLPKYRLYLGMMGYKLPSKHSFITSLNIACNLLYCTSILLGFWFLPRTAMLLVVLLTMLVGPVLILLGLGLVLAALAAFGLYPITSAFTMWCWFFITSHLFQILGRRMGLDQDNDGDVDWLDVLYYLSHNTTWGRYLGLRQVHEELNIAAMDPYQEIQQQLDVIQRSLHLEHENNKKSNGNNSTRNYRASQRVSHYTASQKQPIVKG